MMSEEICQGACCGCTACANICPLHCITMREDDRGFLYPSINQNMCINCKLCFLVCNESIDFKKNIETYVAKHKQECTILSSQSGGAFTAISDYILRRRGIIYGTILNDSYEAVYTRADSSEVRNMMRGSKYVPSNLDKVFLEIKKDLNCGRYVLFVGMPCQVSGLQRFLKMSKQDTSRLYTVDIICHGTPAVCIWRDLLKYYEDKYHSSIKKVIFRDKNHGGWGTHITTIFLTNKQIFDRYHGKLFYTNLALRESCYQCNYAKKDRVGDFTIGDAWGVKEKNPGFYDLKGVSLVMVNSPKAVGMVGELQEDITMQKVELEDYVQENMQAPSFCNRSREEFWKDYFNHKFSYIIKKYARNSIVLNFRYILKKIFRRIREMKK